MAKPKINSKRIDPYKNFKFRVIGREDKPTRDDLRLPASALAMLDQIVESVKPGRRGAAVTGGRALFAGVKGTGKTLAAEVIASRLGVDLYHIDLSKVMSKYIGETEKNLARAFDAAEEADAVLYFDEADALFGKRSEVKDSHDRFANIEVSYLLQRIESYPGTIIFATSRKSNIDQAFLRRLRHIIEFPPPR